MAHRVRSDALGDPRLADGFPDLARHGIIVKVVAGDFSSSWVRTQGCGGKDVLPAPLTGSVGVFPDQRLPHVDIPGAHDKIGEVLVLQCYEVLIETFFQCMWQSDDTVFSAFAIVDGDGALPKIEILDAQTHGFHQAQTAAIHDLSAQFPGIFQVCENGANFFAGHDHRGTALTTGGGEVIQSQFLNAENIFDEEDHGVERLVLGGRGDVPLKGEEIEVSGDGGRASSIRRLAEFLETETDEAAIPVNVGFLGGDGVALEPDGPAKGINEFGEFRFVTGGLFRRRGLQDREFRSHLDRFTGEGAVVRFQGVGLVG
jgi:hypothetical protein